MEENQEKDANGIEDAHAHTRAPVSVRAHAQRTPRKVRSAVNRAKWAQANATQALAVAERFGVDPIPLLPQGQQASTRAFLEARLKQGNGALSLALADRILNDALDTSGNRSLDAARLALEQTEDARIKRTEKVERTARIVLNYGAPTVGMSESEKGTIQESQRTIDARVVDPSAPVLSSSSRPALSSSSEPAGGGDEAAAARGTLLESRVAALENGQQQMLGMLQKLLEATVAREGK